MLKNRSKVICAQRTRTSVVTVVALACALGAWGAEPLCWERTPNRPAPAQFDTYHGETLDFRCTFTGFGALPFVEGADVRLWYQTNGMGAAWWSIPATVSSNVLEAAWPPSADPGVERVAFFFGAPSNAYAAAQVRFRNSPGAHPNDLDPPSALDWQAELAAATNALWESSAAAFMPQSNAYTKAETDARIAELAPRTSLAPATNYTDEAVAAVSNAVAQKADLTRVVSSVKTYLIPNMIASSDWAQGVAGGISHLDYNAISTAADTSGRIWWSGSITDSFDPGGGMVTVYTWATAYYSTVDDTMGAFLWRDAPSELPADVHNLIGYDRSFIFYNNYDNPNGWLDVFSRIGSGGDDIRVYDPDYGDTYWSTFSGTNYAEKVTTHTESVVYSGSLDSATNDLHKSFAPTISNTVTKAYVESLGIEIGISASTATNIALAVSADATNSLAKSFAPTVTNIASTVSSNAIASSDTTYRRTIGLTNLNQSVQYVNITDTTPTTLAISIPTDGATKDWIVYVVSVTNVTLSLPSATWWMADAAYTNDVPPATPTAFYFSQITTNIFYLGRQELTEVAAP